jgi:hypothetical protein
LSYGRVELHKGKVMPRRILNHFTYPNSRAIPEVTDKFQALAEEMGELLDPGFERDECLKRLLESCDWAIRAREVDIANRRHDIAIASMAAALKFNNPTPSGTVAEQRSKDGR